MFVLTAGVGVPDLKGKYTKFVGNIEKTKTLHTNQQVSTLHSADELVL